MRQKFTPPASVFTLAETIQIRHWCLLICPTLSIAFQWVRFYQPCGPIFLGWRRGQTPAVVVTPTLSLGTNRGPARGPSRSLFVCLGCSPRHHRFSSLADTRFPGDLDFNAFFLDDGVITGRFPTVQVVLSSLESRLNDIGLSIARHKTEIVLVCTSIQNFSSQDFGCFSWAPHGNIKLLGAAIGTQEWCESLLGRRVTKAKNLLDAIGRYHDAQGAFTLFRSCSGWAKVFYS